MERVTWRKSSYSGSQDTESNCVEVALTSRVAAVRDSKNAAGPSLEFTPTAWRSFLGAAAL